ncbi:MAG: DHHA1 domain-containing protein, partial [Thiotrichaceae bacterium]
HFAREAGIKVLVTDHHLPGKELPDANVMVNPNLKDDDFPSKALAGVGVVFYVMLALKHCLQEKNFFSEYNVASPNLLNLLDLVALGTVADVVPLDANNRILVEQGLRRVRAGQCCVGIQALFEIADGNASRAVASDFGFTCGPRLNAAGRLDDMSLGIECLLTDSLSKAREIASALNDLNKERRAIETSMKNEAMQELELLDLCKTDNLPAVYCLYSESWHQGVVGILASRIKEMFNRPVIAFAPGDSGELKGSARSIQGIHMRDLLDEVASQNPELLSKFGGHAMAAGLSLNASDFEKFQQAINEIAQRYNEDDTFLETHFTDGELEVEDFTLETAEVLRSAAPWGQHFPAPVFDGKFVIQDKKLLKEIHLRLVLQPVPNSTTSSSTAFSIALPVQAIAFNIDPELWPDVGSEVHILYRFDVNEFRGRLTPQLVIEKLL